MDRIDKLSRTTVILHWIVGFSIIGLLSVGFYMTNTKSWWLYPYHKSIGVIIFFVVLYRVLWRVKNGWPQPVKAFAKFEMVLAKLIHWVLIIATVAMPVSGMLLSGASGHGFGVFGLEIVHANHSLIDSGKVIPYSEFWAETGEVVHGTFAYILVAAVTLHVLAALKHHLVDKDGTLSRMLGKRV